MPSTSRSLPVRWVRWVRGVCVQEGGGPVPPSAASHPGPCFAPVPCATRIQTHDPAWTSLSVQECAGRRATHTRAHRLVGRTWLPPQALCWNGCVGCWLRPKTVEPEGLGLNPGFAFSVVCVCCKRRCNSSVYLLGSDKLVTTHKMLRTVPSQ